MRDIILFPSSLILPSWGMPEVLTIGLFKVGDGVAAGKGKGELALDVPALLLQLLEGEGNGRIVQRFGRDGRVRLFFWRLVVVFIWRLGLPGKGQQAEVTLAVEAKADKPAGLVWFKVYNLRSAAAPMVNGDK